MDYIKIKINEDKAFSMTVSEYLESLHVAKNKIKKMINNGEIKVNNVLSPSDKVIKNGDQLLISFEETIDFLPFDYDLNVLYEDEHILIIDKPKGFIIYPETKDGNNTVVNIVANYYEKNNINRQIRYLHRLDKDTSGVMVFAKNFLALAILTKMLEAGDIKRYYYALVENKLPKSGIITQNIGRDRHDRKKYLVTKNGDYAETHYRVLERLNGLSLLELTLKTGRTHQIRVHLAYLKAPIVGDILYGGKMLSNELMLHSQRVEFIHPFTKETLVIESELPIAFKSLITENK